MSDLTNKELAEILDEVAYWFGKVQGPGGPIRKQQIYLAADRLRKSK